MIIKSADNNWSCVLCAFATAINAELETLIELIGHDGSHKIFPHLEEPFCRRAFQVQEVAIALWDLGYFVGSYDVEPLAILDIDNTYIIEYDNVEKLFEKMMSNSIGVGCGQVKTSGKHHAFAWDGFQCFDPTGFIYPLDRYELYSYHPITRRL